MTKKTIKVSPTTASYILDTNKQYAIYTCSHRAIPNIEDGLKPSQRMPLWLLRNKAGKIKVSALSGMLAAEKIYVHGEQSANNAISFLAAPFKNNTPLIQGVGMFGSRVVPDGIGAPRYVEVARASAAEALLYHDLDLVPQQENYDGSTMQPIHFLPLVPLVLLNGVEGIAVGWSTSILPRSLKSIVEATQAVLAGNKPKSLLPSYDRYDVRVDPIGPNQYEIRGRIKIIDTSTAQVTELPPGLDVEKFLARLDDFEENGVIAGYVDKSSDRIDIQVKFKRGSLAKTTEAKLVDLLKIKEKVTERITVVDFGGSRIKTYESAEDVVVAFVKWRLGWYTTRYEKMLADDTFELGYWHLLRELFSRGFTKKLGTFKNRADLEGEIRSIAAKAKIAPDDRNVERAVNLPTYRWTKEFEAEIEKKIAALEKAVKQHAATLKSPTKLKAAFAADLDSIKNSKI